MCKTWKLSNKFLMMTYANLSFQVSILLNWKLFVIFLLQSIGVKLSSLVFRHVDKFEKALNFVVSVE